jgi:hypothetical protein
LEALREIAVETILSNLDAVLKSDACASRFLDTDGEKTDERGAGEVIIQTCLDELAALSQTRQSGHPSSAGEKRPEISFDKK